MGRRILPVFALLGIGLGIQFYFVGRHVVREMLAGADITFSPLLGTTLSIGVPIIVLLGIAGLSIGAVTKLGLHKM